MFTGLSSDPNTFKEKIRIQANNNILLIFSDYKSNSLSIGIKLEVELIRDLAVKSATP